ncbi:amino acid permease [Paenibacillus sp. HB172176]|uniref:amino acid permease n=1 Tax=Paenibacillus sp. HB172176 TaxID=2493690 RepID=UPI00143A5CCD|nr:amino acid permease [Paenibacillus sp. HB172176]
MLAAYLGFVLAFGVCIVILLIGIKAQRGIENSRYQSMLPYGEETQLMQDKHELHRYGFAQLLRRKMNGISALGLSFNVMALIGGAALIYGPAVQAGGFTVIAVGLPVVALFSILVSASIAELSSQMPTAGGIYHAALRLGGRRLGMRVGIYQWLGQLAMLALFIGGAAYLTDGYAAQRLGYGISFYSFWSWSLVISASYFAVNKWGAAMNRFVQFGAFWGQLLLAALIIGSLAWTFWPLGFDPSELYHWQNADLTGGVSPASFAVGLLLLSKLFLGNEGAAQGAEEIIEPRIKSPWAVFLSSAYMYVIGFVLLFFMSLILLTAGGVSSAMASTSLIDNGIPFLFQQLAGSGILASPLIQLLILISLWQSGSQSMSHCSRLLFSMARDGSVPFSGKLGHVRADRRIPLNALLASGLSALALLALASTATAGFPVLPLLSLSILCLYSSHGISIGLKLKQQLDSRGRTFLHAARKDERGPWQLGSWSTVIHILALLWLGISILLAILCLPSFGLIVTAAATLLSTALLMRYGATGGVSPQKSMDKRRESEDWSRIERDYSA